MSSPFDGPQSIPFSAWSDPKTVQSPAVRMQAMARPRLAELARGGGDLGLLLLPGALIVYLGFNSGGTYAGATGIASCVVLLALAVRTALARRPFAGMGWPALLAGVAFALFAGWTLASSLWSDAAGRALVDTNRTLLYVGLVWLVASIGWTPGRMRVLLVGLMLGLGTIAIAGLVARLFPDVFSVDLGPEPDRLTAPVTYWNAMAIVAGVAAVIAGSLTCDDRAHPVWRVVGAVLCPLFAATLILTFSRGAVFATLAGLLLYLVLGRPRGTLTGLAATAPLTAVAALATLDADLLASKLPVSEAATSQGHDLATTLALCALGAGALRAALLLLDRPLARVRVSDRVRRASAVTAVGGAVAAIAVALAVLSSNGWLERQYDQFRFNDTIEAETQRERLTALGNNGRLEFWDVALDAWRADRLKGQGAGTWELEWELHREGPADRYDAHGLYVETLGELGNVGALLLGIVLLTGGVSLLVRLRSPNRAVQAAGLAVLVTWGLHAAVEFDWEIPVTTVPAFAVVGLAIARRDDAPDATAGQPPALLRPVVCLALVALLWFIPLRVGQSQQHLQLAASAMEQLDCGGAVSEAQKAVDVLPERAEPWEILGICTVARDPRSAIGYAEEAVRRDPNNWRFHYSLGIVRAAAGLRAASQFATARRLNPFEEAPRTMARRIRGKTPRELQRERTTFPLPDD